MRILLANKFYYARGGDCIYTLNLEELLRRHGHDTAVFAMQHPQNLATNWASYFPSEVGTTPGLGALKTAWRALGRGDVRTRFRALLDAFRPDIVHLNNIHTQLSPVLAQLAHRRRIRVVWTLHDFKLLCPRYDCLRNGKQVCETCFVRKRGVLKYGCMKNSWSASFLAYGEAKYWSRHKLEATTDRFICPSRFLAAKMVQGGFDPAKISVLCNAINVTRCQNPPGGKEDYYCMVGRLSPEKGVFTLLEAAAALPFKLVVVGDGPLRETAMARAANHVEFTGHLTWDSLKPLLGRARFSVIPSECYENNPLALIESHCLGTPVLGSRIGGIPELLEDGVNGMTFTPGDASSLKTKIRAMFAARFDYRSIAETAQIQHDAEHYYEHLLHIYRGAPVDTPSA